MLATRPLRPSWLQLHRPFLTPTFIPHLSRNHRTFSTLSPHLHPSKSSLRALQLPPSVERSRLEAAHYFPTFNLQDHVIIITGGGRGLGLSLASAMYQAGAKAHCLDLLPTPHPDFHAAQKASDSSLGGTLTYHEIDIRDTVALQSLIAEIAAKHERMDGLIAAAGVQRQCPALEYPVEAIREMMEVNYVAVYTSAQEVARQMIKWGTPGAMCLIASMSATVS
jgi:hypothetical protein